MTRVYLGDVAREIKKKASVGHELPTVGLEHLDSGEVELARWDEGAETTFTKAFSKGQVLFGRRRAYLRKAAIAPFDGICSGDITVIAAKDGLSPRLLPFIIQNDALFEHAVTNSAGSLSPRVKWQSLSQFEFELPSGDRQEELADILWAAQETRSHYRQLLTACDDVVKSQFVEMFSSVNSNDLRPLKDVCSIITDGTHQPPKFIDKGIPFLFVSNIVSDVISYETNKFISAEDYEQLIHRTPVEEGDVLVSAVGSFGHPAIVTDDRPFCFQRHIAYLKPRHDLIDSNYLHAALLSENAQRYMDRCAKGAAQRTVTLKNFKDLKVPVPPLALQQEFATLAASVDKSKFAIQKALDELSATTKKILNQELGLGDV
uniref:restriction endonuclease subunit S n=1 Tax=Parolsenella massiliensis TaxID=1871022 RepID=UPI0009342646|nr:restriction endonuclease subunit S [Parolsenella massiliensis]